MKINYFYDIRGRRWTGSILRPDTTANLFRYFVILTYFQLDPNGNTESDVPSAKPSPSKQKEPSPDGTWSISLEQFLATMLAEEVLEEFFNENVSLLSLLEGLKQRVDRLQSIS